MGRFGINRDSYGFEIPDIYNNAGSSPTPASPLNLVTSCPCEFWYDGQDAATVSLVGAGVSQWDDKSVNARHVTQAVAGQRPTYNPLTGRLTFLTANTTLLQSAAFGPLAQPLTIYILYRISGALGDTDVVVSGGLLINRYMIYNSALNFICYSGANLQGSPPDANDNIHAIEYNNPNTNYWINGVLVAGPGVSGANALGGITFGARDDGVAPADAEIMEVFGYNCIITAAEHTALRNYLTTKWGL